METQTNFPFWDKVIDKKLLEIKKSKEMRKNQWIEKNLKKTENCKIKQEQIKTNKSWENM